MSVINYDRPVKDLIAGLNATGHVTHTTHRKDMVTIHHNGGRLSHEGVLEVWKTRPASAHFDVDGVGAVAQYVNLNEYAWACGNNEGNQRSISIEMCNSAVGGDWPVYTAAWYEAARLAGWIFAKAIGTRPNRDNLVVHHHWKATACAGPYIDGVMGTLIALANLSYEYFKSAPPTPTPNPEGDEVVTSRLVRGDSTELVPGKSYAWGNLYFMVSFNAAHPWGAVRRYISAGPVQRVLESAQGGVDVVPQADVDGIPYVTGGEPPAHVVS